jgi:predicted enzyme related to lactoylglutathione lyase
VPDAEAEIADVIVYCSDPERVASFWADLLGRPIAGRKGPYVWLARPEGAVGVGFQKVGEPRLGKNRMHLDIAVPDLVAGRMRVEGLGGRRVEGYELGGFLVMADPEGNAFCLIPLAPFQLDDDGRADYLDRLNI